MDRVPSPVTSSPTAYDHHPLHAHKHLASLYSSQGFLHPALSHQLQQFPLPPHLQNIHDPFRPRSGSLLSLGSTGSSYRPERSPSRESTSSHDSLPRASPVPGGYTPESPSPSPPNESSKLLNLLKGTSQSPFSGLFNKPANPDMPVPVSRKGSFSSGDGGDRGEFRGMRSSGGEHVMRRQSVSSEMRHLTLNSRPYPLPNMYSSSSSSARKSSTPSLLSRDLYHRSNSISESQHPLPSLIHRSNSISEPLLKRHVELETPMDLSCKRPRRATMASLSNIRRRLPPPTETVTQSSLINNGGSSSSSRHSDDDERMSTTPAPATPKSMIEPISPPSRAPSRDSVASHGSSAADDSSILRSILCGGGLNSSSGASETSYPSRPASVKSDASGAGMMLNPTSPGGSAMSEPASPSHSILSRLMAGSPCNAEANQRVGIAKKTLFPVRARVSFWLGQTVKFAKSLAEFSSLCFDDQMIVINNTWAKMLVVFMAENNFEFAVSTVAAGTDSDSAADTAGNPEVPTMKAVENVQGFIHKLHGLNLDVTEYEQLKTIVLFEIGTLPNNFYSGICYNCAQVLHHKRIWHYFGHSFEYSCIH